MSPALQRISRCLVTAWRVVLNSAARLQDAHPVAICQKLNDMPSCRVRQCRKRMFNVLSCHVAIPRNHLVAFNYATYRLHVKSQFGGAITSLSEVTAARLGYGCNYI